MPVQRLPALTPFSPRLPDVAGAIGARETRQQNRDITASNLRGTEIAQRVQEQNLRTGQEAAQSVKQQQRVQQLGSAFANVNDQASFDIAIQTLRSLTPPGEAQQFDQGLERLFPGGQFNQGTVDQIKQQAGVTGQLPISTRPGSQLKDPITGALIGEQTPFKPTDAGADSKLIYSKRNPDGSVRTIKNVRPGTDQERQLAEQGFVRGTQTVGVKPSVEERKESRLRGAVDDLSERANIDPNKFYEDQDFKQNDDGSLFIDPVSNAPVRLLPFFKATGKRGNIKAIIRLGEQWDDAKELTELLSLPSVQANLKKANDDGIWDRVAGKWSNKVTKWMQDSGISGDSPTATAVARIQRMTSEERKTFMGVAVTKLELQSALAWMPSAGDSFESIVNKTNLMGKEADQEFRRWIDVFEGAGADMSPYTKAFGIKRFGQQPQIAPIGTVPIGQKPEIGEIGTVTPGQEARVAPLPNVPLPQVLNFDAQGNLTP